MANSHLWTKRAAISITALALLLFIGYLLIWWIHSTTVILIIRHAEKDNTLVCSPSLGEPLSDLGQYRAQTLVHVCQRAGISAIYASEFCRTQQTVEPLASHLNLIVNVVDQIGPDGNPNVDNLISQLLDANKGKVVLIAGHTSTVPVIIQKLGGGIIAPISENEFDNLFVVTVTKWWWRSSTKVVHLKYGKQT